MNFQNDIFCFDHNLPLCKRDNKLTENMVINDKTIQKRLFVVIRFFFSFMFLFVFSSRDICSGQGRWGIPLLCYTCIISAL